MENKTKILRKYFPIIPIVLLNILIIITVIEALLDSNGGLTWSNYLAILTVALLYIVFLKFRKYFKIVLLITIILGYTNILNFTYFTFSGWFRIGPLKIIIHPIISLVLVITYIFNYRLINSIIAQMLFRNKLTNEEYEQIIFTQKYEEFKINFTNKNDEELLKISNDERYLLPARAAAKDILKERI